MKYKQLKIAIFVTAILILTTTFFNNVYVNDIVISEHKVNKISNILSINYETAAGSGEYTTSSDNNWPTTGYTFNEKLSKCKNGSEITWDKENNKVMVKGSVTDSCYVYFDVLLLVNYVKEEYRKETNNSIFLHNGSYKATATEVAANSEIKVGYVLDANDRSYRYYGDNPNNWVCFGTDAEICDNEHLYRIIGVFDSVVIDAEGNSTIETEERIKLIKAYEGTETSLGTTYFSTAAKSNTYYRGNPDLTSSPGYQWKASSPNNLTDSILYSNILNGTYLAKLGTTWADKIATTEWKIGGNSWDNVGSEIATNVYQSEIVNPVLDGNNKKTTNAKIGLMYVSDYGFSASPENWATKLDSYNNDLNRNNNWVFLGVFEWTITRRSDYLDGAFAVSSDNGVSYNNVNDHYITARPSFSLKSSICYAGGTGTSTDPIRIN